MKKSILSTVLLSALLLVGCSSSDRDGTSSTSSVSSESSSVVSTSSEKTPEQLFIDSLQGTWVNSIGESFKISGRQIFLDGEESGHELIFHPDSYEVSVKAGNFGLTFAKAGSTFSEGIIGPDSTDQTKDRFIAGQAALESETADKFVYYK